MDQRDFAETFMQLVQDFGLLANDRTPCGEDLSVTQAHALTMLYRDAPLSQQELAERLRLEKSTVSRMVDDLETKSWVERCICDDDRRQKLIHLTESGRKRADSVSGARLNHFEAILDQIPENERNSVHESLKTLRDAINSTTRNDEK